MKRYLCFICLSLGFYLSTKAQDFNAHIESHREAYKTAFVKDQNSPLKAKDLPYLDFYAPDSLFRVQAKVKYLLNEKSLDMPTSSGQHKSFIRYARVSFELQGQSYSLTLFKNLAFENHPIYKDDLFLPFLDLSNETDTYAGGRYLDLKLSAIQHQEVTIDFNKAYNPYCVYSDGYNCPIPPEENNLNVAILAGEKNYKGQKKR